MALLSTIAGLTLWQSPEQFIGVRLKITACHRLPQLGIEYVPHRALNDAYATAKLFTELALRDDAAHCNY